MPVPDIVRLPAPLLVLTTRLPLSYTEPAYTAPPTPKPPVPVITIAPEVVLELVVPELATMLPATVKIPVEESCAVCVPAGPPE